MTFSELSGPEWRWDDADVVHSLACLRVWAVKRTLERTRFTFSSEKELQAGIVQRLLLGAADVMTEVRLDAASRIDVLMEPGVAIEVKTAGHVGDVLRQVERYLAHDRVTGLVLVTTRPAHVRLEHDVRPLRQKPFAVCLIGGLF